LMGEEKTYLLSGKNHQELMEHLDGVTPLSVLLARLNFYQRAILLHTIEGLTQKGFIEKKETPKNKDSYHQPDFSLSPIIREFSSKKLTQWILSQFDDKESLSSWTRKLRITKSTSIVIVDDYLDPRLSDINLTHIQQKQPWLLVKLTGKQPLLGPYFIPGAPNTPCWQCLATRLLHNQPARRWLQQQKMNESIRVPIKYNAQSVLMINSIVGPLAQQLIDQRVNNRLHTIDPESLSIFEHPVSYRPQCQHCADPNIFSQHSSSPVKLKTCLKNFSIDGGTRLVAPQQTIQNIQNVLSPLTGIINNINKISDNIKNGVSTYETSFFTSPYLKYKLENDDFVKISMGKGISDEQSKASALCESIERHAAQYQGDEPWIWGAPGELATHTIFPQQLACFSERQYGEFQRQLSNQQPTGYLKKHLVNKYSTDTPLHWTPAWSFTQQVHCYVPFTYCYGNTPFEDEIYSRFNSNGCAAGNTLEEAILQGFLELIERDATAIWWYNKATRPAVCLDELPKESIDPLENSLSGEWDYWVLDLTHDFDIPVMVAIGLHRKSKIYSLGFGCHLDSRLACQRALTELCQLIAIKDQHSAPFNFKEIATEPFLLPKENTPEKQLSKFKRSRNTDIKDDILFCVEQAKRLELETLVVDYTRPDLPIHTARVIVPGLCHIWPQLGNERLYQIPVKLGWRESPLKEEELNPLPLFI